MFGRGQNSLVSSVASIEPDSVEAKGEELSDDGPQSAPSSQQQLNKCPRIDCLQADTLAMCSSTHALMDCMSAQACALYVWRRSLTATGQELTIQFGSHAINRLDLNEGA